jgi:hypothetical protein
MTEALARAARAGHRMQDFGRLQMAGVLLVLTAVVSIPLATVYGTWAGQQAMRVEWDVTGPACPVATSIPPDFYVRRRPMSFTYGGARFTRQFGAVSCVFVPEPGLFGAKRYPVCQFTSPATIMVGVGEDRVVFEPGIGHSATVTLRRGQPRCVVGGPFRFWD